MLEGVHYYISQGLARAWLEQEELTEQVEKDKINGKEIKKDFHKRLRGLQREARGYRSTGLASRREDKTMTRAGYGAIPWPYCSITDSTSHIYIY